MSHTAVTRLVYTSDHRACGPNDDFDFSQLAKNYNQALLAKGEQRIEDVRLGAPAVPPERPQSRGLLSKVLLAVLVGAIIGLGLSLVRESWG